MTGFAAPVSWSLERDRANLLVAVGLGAFVAASHLEAAVTALPAGAGVSAGLAVVGLAVAAWTGRVARRPSAGTLRAGAIGALVLLALWAWTRAVGVPFAGGQRAPVGVLDAVTALDELLLAGFALAAARPTWRRRPRERWPLVGTVAISLSFIVLAMGCEPVPVQARAAGDAPAWVCHLY